MDHPEVSMFDTTMPERLSERQMHLKLQSFTKGLIQLEAHPPGKSVELVAFSQTAQYLLGEGVAQLPEFQEVVYGFLARPTLTPSIAVQLFWRTFQYELMNVNPDTPGTILDRQIEYPEGHRTHEAWMKTFTALLKNGDSRNEIEEFLSIKLNQSTQPDRYLGAYLAILLHKSLLGDRPTVVEAGCASRIGLSKLESHTPFTNFTIDAEPRIRKRIRELLSKNKDYELGKMVGFDLAEIDVGALRWIEAISNYPSEIHLPGRQREREILYSRNGALPLQADITINDKRLQAVRDALPGGRADVGFELTTFYLIPREMQPVADANLSSLVSKLKYVQDAVRIDPKDDRKLIYSDFDDRAVGYNGVVQYQDGSDTRYRQLLSFRDGGRAKVLVPKPAMLELIEAT